MYAVIKAGGHQHKVAEGDVLEIDYQEGKEGDSLKFDQVLMIGGEKTVLGEPLVAGASVEAVIKTQKRQPKIIVYKFKRRQGYKRKAGHKQPVTQIQVTNISQ